jgi:cytochrome c-type biogenesis protein CcmE
MKTTMSRSRIDDELEQAVRDAEADDSSPGASGAAPSASPAVASSLSGAVAARAGARGVGGDVARPVVADAEEQKRSWGLLAGLIAVGAGVLLFVFNSGEDAVVYSYQVDDLKAQAADIGDRQVRVQGILVPGTLVRRDEPCEHRFMMQKQGVKNAEPLKVQYAQCVVPDTFREVAGVEVEVTAEGRMAEDGHLEASKIFAKCPSKYEMREGAAALGQAPQHGGGMPKPEFVPPKVEAIR